MLTASVNFLTGLAKWKVTFNNSTVSGDDYGTNLMIGADGDIYVIGTVLRTNGTGYSGKVLRYNAANGIVVRSLALNSTGNGNEIGRQIANGPAGFLFAACSHGTSVNVYKLQTGNTLVLNGTALYGVTPSSPFTSVTDVTINDIKVAISNNVYITGTVYANSASGTFTADYLAKFGVSGPNFTMLNSLGGVYGNFNESLQGTGIALDNLHNDVIFLQSSALTNVSHLQEFIYISNLEGGPSLREAQGSISETTVSEISFYPNPASGTIYFNSNAEVFSVEVYDIAGKMITALKPYENSLNISMLRPGVYFGKVTDVSGSSIKRIVVQ